MMPEMFGCCHHAGLTPQHRDAVAHVARQLGGESAGTGTTSWTHVGTVAHHPGDPVSLTTDGPFTRATIGAATDQRPPFARCIVDDANRSLDLVSDPFGLHPVYYAVQNEAMVFCTKLNPLLGCGIVDWELDRVAVMDFFTYEHVTGDHTLASSVKVLKPGSTLKYRNGDVSIEAHDGAALRFPEHAPGPRSLRDAADQMHASLCDSVNTTIDGRRRVAITLTGGLDSRALLGCVTSIAGVDVRAYTFGLPGSREVALAAELSRTCDVPHEVIPIDGSYLREWLDHGVQVTGGMVSCTHYHILSLCKTVAAEADVVLDGLAGDAWTGAHLDWRMRRARTVREAADAVYRRRATAWASAEERRKLFTGEFLAAVGNYDPRRAVDRHFVAAEPPWAGCHRFDFRERQRRFIQFGPHQLRSNVDVATPFYDLSVVGLLSSVPLEWLAGQRLYYAMHRRRLAELARVADSTRGVPVSWPRSARFAKRVADYGRRRLLGEAAGMSPTDYATWFRRELRELVEERLLQLAASPLAEIVQMPYVERLVRSHLDGSADQTTKIGCLLTLDAWLRSLGPVSLRLESAQPGEVVAPRLVQRS